jgi:phosphoesterase RecJ-like protein
MKYEPVRSFLSHHDKFILTVHETPDGDALGSEYAMLRALRQLGKTAQIFNADPAPAKFSFVADEDVFTVLQNAQQLPADIEDYCLLILDVNDINNIGSIAELVLPRVRGHFIIDHHDSETDTLSGNLIQQNASSTAEILFQLFREMKIAIDLPMARALYMAIVYDTGSFIYPKTTALTFDIAHQLVDLGVNPNMIYSHVYESNSTPSLRLMSRVLSTLELALNNHVAIQTMTRGTLLEVGAQYEEADQIINIPLRSKEVKVSVFFKENLEGIKRCSLRSKGNIDVAEIAQSFGGGGHKTAAGFKCAQPFPVLKEKILARLGGYFE